jgi:hypothetical protein
MITRANLDRAAAVLGAVSVASAGFEVLRGDFGFVRIRGWAVAVAVVLGALALLAGWTARRALTVAAGVGFLTAALVQVAMWAASNNVLSGDGSTASFWLGLGLGLLATGLAPRIWPDAHDEHDTGRT